MEFKSGYVAVVGRPNAGKSTLLNKLVKFNISIISDKPQTTRDIINFIYTDDDAQIIFMDTPGYQIARNKLGDYMDKAMRSALEDADMILYIIDGSVQFKAGEKELMDIVTSANKDVVIAINKIDKKESHIDEIIAEINSRNLKSITVPISAGNDENLDKLLDEIKNILKPGPMYYDGEYLTDKPMKFIVSEIIRQKCLLYLSEEIPHGINIEILKYEELEDSVNIDAIIYCERDSHKGIVIGKDASMIKKIRLAAKKDIKAMLDTEVNLKLNVKVAKNWRKNEDKVKFFGYK
ncbi:GTPase Era [Fenollaria massiliensis]|uniref:GTPase Era n=1 Tax=Fenollaria massiliensis TaxID=938288 RepID=A0A9E7DKI5_9FIRM|nr:GTPase Era [Fenollaria massiliensis]UQK59744.1 GTPase Era [Fenollaria massiliensis]